MDEPSFFTRHGPFRLADLASRLGASFDARDADTLLSGVGSLEAAEAGDLTFLAHRRYAPALAACAAAACLVCERDRAAIPAQIAALVVRDPQRAFAAAAALFFPDAVVPQPMLGTAGISPAAHIHAAARLEDGVVVEAGAVVGSGAAIGRGTVVAPGAVIGPGVRIGRDCRIGPHAVVQHALLGDRVVLHPGVKIGQDGFGYAMGAQGHAKIPQLGRVVIQNDVEIGAGTTVDRGALDDTVIGEGSKFDNLVQIGHNVRIGRHCLFAAACAIGGSTVIGDFVAVGGGTTFSDHLKVGDRAQIAGCAALMHDVPAGARWGGYPAQDIREEFREIAFIRKLVRDRRAAGQGED